METIDINLTKPVVREEEIHPIEMYDNGGILTIVVEGVFDITIGDILKFKREVSSESEGFVNVENFRTSVTDVRYLKNNNYITHTVITCIGPYKKQLFVAAYGGNETDDEDRCLIRFQKRDNIFAQDIVYAKSFGVNTTIQILDTATGEYNDIADNINFIQREKANDNKKRYNYITSGSQSPEKYIMDFWTETDYKNCEGDDTENPQSGPMYYYLPSNGYNTRILAAFNFAYSEDTLSTENIYYKHNTFYFTDEDETTSELDETIVGKKCHIWKDVSAVTIDNTNYLREDVWSNPDKYNHISLVKETGYWKIPVGLSQSADYTHLHQEDNVNVHFSDKIKNDVIKSAPVIDMERVKYAPYVLNELYEPLTSITYNLHFRVRNNASGDWSYIKGDSVYWNEGVNPTNLINNNKSDLLYYLDFTDGDVLYQKKKLTKSFLRISFYDSKDPITQKLLYYTTIFVDGGSLSGKFIKAKTELSRKNMSTENVVLDSDKTSYRLDCHFTVMDEFNTTKSSDGFNIYYFPDVVENGERTIYMKVEFNHAGYGRTIPFILWNSTKESLTLDEIKEGMYIPITLKRINKTENINKENYYTYSFDTDSEYVTIENNSATLNLVEPKV